MGKLSLLDIELSRTGPHLSGGAVSGHLLIKSKKDLEIARIVVHLYGGGKVEFYTEYQQPAAGTKVTTAFRDSQSYLSLSQVVLDRETLAKGQLRRLGFELRLPHSLPSSFMTVVAYSLAALVDRGPSGKKSYSLTRPIIVIADVDLNRHQPVPGDGNSLWRPIEAWGHWQSCAQQQQQRQDGIGLATVHLQADKRGFAVGESISLRVEVRNNTKQRLESLRVCLTQKAEFKAAAADGLLARREQRLAVQQARLQERLKPGASLLEEGVRLPVPWVATAAAAAGETAVCRLLRVTYWLQVVCSVTPTLSPIACLESPLQTMLMAPKFDKAEQVMLLLEEPITIGTRQLVPADAADAAAAMAQASAPPPDFLQDLTLFSLAPSAPPSYEESVAGGAWGWGAAAAPVSSSPPDVKQGLGFK